MHHRVWSPPVPIIGHFLKHCHHFIPTIAYGVREHIYPLLIHYIGTILSFLEHSTKATINGSPGQWCWWFRFGVELILWIALLDPPLPPLLDGNGGPSPTPLPRCVALGGNLGSSAGTCCWVGVGGGWEASGWSPLSSMPSSCVSTYNPASLSGLAGSVPDSFGLSPMLGCWSVTS